MGACLKMSGIGIFGEVRSSGRMQASEEPSTEMQNSRTCSVTHIVLYYFFPSQNSLKTKMNVALRK